MRVMDERADGHGERGGGWDGVGDGELMDAARAGDAGAMEALLVRFRPRVWSVCRRMVGAQEADDLTQETLIRVVRGIPAFKGEAMVSTWVIRVAMNVCLSYRRRQARRAGIAAMEGGLEDEGRAGTITSEVAGAGAGGGNRGVGGGVERGEELARVERGLARIDEMHRAVLVLRDVQGLDYGQVAEVLGIKRGTVKSRLSRAREALRRAIEAEQRERRGGTDTDGTSGTGDGD